MENNSVWNLYKVKLEKHTVLNIFTKEWNYRWWKIYSKDKVFTILSWKVEVITFENNKDIKNIYKKWELIKIKAWIPNIFYFPEGSEILEWFEKDVETREYKRYYRMKEKNSF